jgi:RNA polymerase sigma factor (sigma-70 family)
MESDISPSPNHIEAASAPSDSALVLECLKGNPQGWIELLDRYKRLIYAVTVRFGFANEDRHDIFQVVCLEILKNLSSLRNASSLRYWILTITVRKCCVLRKRHQQEGVQDRDDAALVTPDPRSNTMEIYLAARRAEILHEAMEELPDRCRSLLNLLFFNEEKTPYSQVGSMLGWSKDTVGSARLRCLDRLRKILALKGF